MQRLARLLAAGSLVLATDCALYDTCGPEDRRVVIRGDVLDTAHVASLAIGLLQSRASMQSGLAVSFWGPKPHEPSPLANHVLSATLMVADSVVMELPPTLFSAPDVYSSVPGSESEDTRDAMWTAFKSPELRLVLTTDVRGMESLSIPLQLATLEGWHEHPCN